MKELAIGIFVVLLLAALSSGPDPLGWEAQARIEQQTQLQVATIQANAQLEAIRLKQTAARERAQIRAALIQQFLQVLPMTVTIICAALLLGLLMYYRGKQQMALATASLPLAPDGYLETPQRLLPTRTLPLLELSRAELHRLQQQAQTANHRLDVVRQQGHHQALLIDNVTGQIRAQRGFVMNEVL